MLIWRIIAVTVCVVGVTLAFIALVAFIKEERNKSRNKGSD